MPPALSRVGKPDSPGLNQRDKDSDHKVHVLRCSITGRCGQLDTAAAEEPIQGALMLHNCVGQRAVKNGNQQAQQQSRDFYDHIHRV